MSKEEMAEINPTKLMQQHGLSPAQIMYEQMLSALYIHAGD